MENLVQSVPSEDSLHAPLLQLWRRFLKTEDVSIDDDFFEKGGDSLLALDLQLEIQRLTGRELPESLLFEVSTIRALAKRLSRPAGARQAPFVRTVSGEGRPAMVFFHGDRTADGAFVEHLLRALAPEQPVRARALRGANGGTMAASIVDIAASQLPLILETQPRGSYRLGGHREGALVAFETARLLAAAGHGIELVAMVDPTDVAAREHRDAVDASAAYVPAPIPVPLLVFATASEGEGWRRVSPDVEVISLPGSRSDWVTGHSATVARYLRARLQSIVDARGGAKQDLAAVSGGSNLAGG